MTTNYARLNGKKTVDEARANNKGIIYRPMPVALQIPRLVKK